MIEVGRNTWRLSGPTPQLKQGHIDSVAQGDTEYLQEWRFHNQSGWPVLVLGHSHNEKCFLVCFTSVQDVCPWLLVLSWGTTEKSLIPSFQFPHFPCSPSLLSSRLNSPSSFSISLQEKYPVPSSP